MPPDVALDQVMRGDAPDDREQLGHLLDPIAELVGAREGLQHLRRGMARYGDERLAETRLQPEFEAPAILVLRQVLQAAQSASGGWRGLRDWRIRAAPAGPPRATAPRPCGRDRRPRSGSAISSGRMSDTRVRSLVMICAICRCSSLRLSSSNEVVGGVAHQLMLENVMLFGSEMAAGHQPGGHDVVEQVPQALLIAPPKARQEPVRERAPDHCPQLRSAFGLRTQPVELRHERVRAALPG